MPGVLVSSLRTLGSTFVLFAAAVGCARTQTEERPGDVTLAAPGTSTAMMPITSSSASAKNHFMLGLREFDVGTAPAARAHFALAVAADDSFALAHLFSAFTAASIPSYRAHLERAVELADRATTAEQLMIRIERRGFAGDVNGQLDLAQQLAQAAPTSPRALQTLATVQFTAGRVADARATLERAIVMAPRFAPTYFQLGNSYLVIEPRDLAKAETQIRRGVELEPNEANSHDFMGDVYRAQNKLAEARAEYTRMAELDPARALAFQQRGHVNSFLGNFAEARADYDRAIALGSPDEKASFAVYRALTSVHAGDPAAAEQELERVLTTIDGMNLPNAIGAKLFALNTQFLIALHSNHVEVAERATDRLRTLYQQQADEGRTPEFRRGTQANIVLIEGFLAVRKGDYDGGRAKAREYMQLRAPENNPRKNEGGHALLGFADLAQGNAQAAIGHLEQADPNDVYVTFVRAVALERAGRTGEAQALYKRVAETNFNSTGLALTKREAARKAG
jgi:tetratricopeptide (TPR) repeat protein